MEQAVDLLDLVRPGHNDADNSDLGFHEITPSVSIIRDFTGIVNDANGRKQSVFVRQMIWKQLHDSHAKAQASMHSTLPPRNSSHLWRFMVTEAQKMAR